MSEQRPEHKPDPWRSLYRSECLTGISRIRLVQLALDGAVRAQRVGGRTFLHRDDLERLRRDTAVTAA
jgi:hypothetical protein